MGIHEIDKERIKQTFLAIIKWCSSATGARVVFDLEDSCPRADVNKKIIHMPIKIAVNKSDSTLGILIHESMHIKHTPKWLSDICRDRTDKMIINGLEDRRIEMIACQQLRALDNFLNQTVEEVRANVDPDKVPLGLKVLSNIACAATKNPLFKDNETKLAEIHNKALHSNLLGIYERVFQVTMGKSFEANVEELYQRIDEFRKEYKLPDVDPSQKEEMDKEEQGELEEGAGEREGGNYGLSEFMEGKSSKLPGERTHVDMEELNQYLIDLNEQAKERIKETLKKSLTILIDEGRQLNTDNLTSIFTGNIDDLFNDTTTERKMRTKIYFLMDNSGSMNSGMSIQGIDLITTGKTFQAIADNNRQNLAISSFQAIAEVIDECKGIYGVDIDYNNYVFSDDCKKVDTMSIKDCYGGGTNLHNAMQVVFKDIHHDDPANKRILVIMTDGDVGNTDEIKKLITKEAQDIRVVFVGITDEPHCDLIKHNIVHEDHGEAMIVEAMEECL